MVSGKLPPILSLIFGLQQPVLVRAGGVADIIVDILNSSITYFFSILKLDSILFVLRGIVGFSYLGQPSRADLKKKLEDAELVFLEESSVNSVAEELS